MLNIWIDWKCDTWPHSKDILRAGLTEGKQTNALKYWGYWSEVVLVGLDILVKSKPIAFESLKLHHIYKALLTRGIFYFIFICFLLRYVAQYIFPIQRETTLKKIRE